ncbi:hypothetical protein [Mycolicibacterium fluoranthenivorans]|uniref:LppX_LprAFG lipoprotein n=1 Tax=Mycolicibacterium fluoranthenivorans TaxID=258505 RepID=A0A1G4V6Q9_9MYCO|nr:hypothetical protein [Mycolicibacterium fluoranthenivorans]SCX02100.1 hypothetical protein SAMN02799620_00382 [Mycolicibacterium fluoranthenivorans]
MTVTRLGLGLAAAALTISALSGCSTIADVQKITEAATSAVQQIQDGTGATGDVLTADGLDKAFSAIAEKVGATPMQVVEVTLIPTTATVQAIDPNAPTELNQWTYTAGHVGASRPVDYDDDAEALRQNLFVLTDVPTSAIIAAVDGAVAASGIADGKVQSVVIDRNLPFDDNLRILINVQGDRSNKQVRADAGGHITDVV